ncbi:glucosamine--fructose-6-phosphate aminotransferase [Halanaerobium saccharolyticum subsp. saccharolyticum DSM 6643]|uniref:Glutamine--fructose-6-phosphate aminotransferase [isomerizing] n=1 Tax=Halanaerobium saccharolyticum subsp. saccharolyticum DSM 6643 TaxID=1293054 RepID=M5E0D3_9FIRM|nr:SIS domain-containing protein [Halanaerobium saccharolyticum]CCU78917.1 glucosamine--fructose-6-phosphate aminotransferase [Halanaerobium saccharolyticum subsp. saccharolyticum DSM 6643]
MSDPMIKDIKSQPEFLNMILTNYFEDTKYKKRLKEVINYIEDNDNPILFAGMGSSNYSAISAINILSNKGYLCLNPNIDEFIHYQMNSINENVTVIAISQSGKSAETKKLLEKLSDNTTIIAITNYEDSPIAQMSDFVLPIFAGKEATISTKTYVNSNYLLNIIAHLVDNNKGLDIKKQSDDIEIINNFIVQAENTIHNLYNHLKSKDKWSFISRGDLLSTTFMGALICAEGTGLQPKGYSGGSFRHGPLEITGKNHGAIVFAHGDHTFNLLIKLTEEMAQNGSNIILLTDKNYNNESDNILLNKIPIVNRLLLPTIYAVVIQLFTRETALNRGRIPGMLNKISKVTEKE